jgi:hypothetical protein
MEAAISRVLCPARSRPRVGGKHSSRTGVTAGLQRDYPEIRWPDQPVPQPRGRADLPICSCSRWGLPCRRHYCRRGALLPHRFTLACPVKEQAVYFLWRSPAGHPDRSLTGTLSCGARTFLPRARSCSAPASTAPPPAEQRGLSRKAATPQRRFRRDALRRLRRRRSSHWPKSETMPPTRLQRFVGLQTFGGHGPEAARPPKACPWGPVKLTGFELFMEKQGRSDAIIGSCCFETERDRVPSTTEIMIRCARGLHS